MEKTGRIGRGYAIRKTLSAFCGRRHVGVVLSDVGKFIKGYSSEILSGEVYDRYPHQFELQLADVMRNKADLFCQRSRSGEDGEKKRFKDICYDILYNAYEKYRRNADLHGIANVLQSMGNVENYEVFIEAEERNRRSSICFYNAASSLYEYLGDEWSRHVVNGFKKGAMEKRKNI